MATGNAALVKARTQARLSQRDLATKVRAAGGGSCNASTVSRWESGELPQPRMLAALESALGLTADQLGFGHPSVLAPPGFAAGAIAGRWVTAYQFPHGDRMHHHAEVAELAAEGDAVTIETIAGITEGRSVPFANVAEAQLVGRHLLGLYRNVSDQRYFGYLHLAVLPGETVMDGYYTGLASDISVSSGRWRWVRLDGDIELADPIALYNVVMNHSPYEGKLDAHAPARA